EAELFLHDFRMGQRLGPLLGVPIKVGIELLDGLSAEVGTGGFLQGFLHKFQGAIVGGARIFRRFNRGPGWAGPRKENESDNNEGNPSGDANDDGTFHDMNPQPTRIPWRLLFSVQGFLLQPTRAWRRRKQHSTRSPNSPSGTMLGPSLRASSGRG